MLRKSVLIAVLFMSLAGVSLASQGDSKYVKLHIFDARTNGPVTMYTSEINVFLDLIDMGDYVKNTGIKELAIKLAQHTEFNINDLQNQFGTIRQIIKGDITLDESKLGSFNGVTNLYLGRYSITPPKFSRYFKGGVVIQFNFYTSDNVSLYASEMIPFYKNDFPFSLRDKD